MVRLRIRCRCVALAVVVSQIFLGFWFFSQPLDPPKQFLKRLFSEGGQTILHLTDHEMSHYYTFFGKDLCVKEGIIAEESSEGNCVCRKGWKGRRCGVPEVMQKAKWMQNEELSKNLQLRKRARRVILVTPFSYEFDIFETNVNELNGLVDIFVIGETNYTEPGSKTSLPVLNKLKKEWLKDFQDRIIYVPVTESDLKKSSFMQNLVHTGLRLVSDIRPDDLFILTNGEEILSRDVLTFLKLFQGYPLPVKCQYREHVYGFYWRALKSINTTQPQVCASSFQFLANAFEYQVSRLQEGSVLEEDLNFFTTHEQPVSEWTVPDAGWKCHLCLSVQNIFRKFLNLPKSYRPKWFTESSSAMLPFIQRLVKFGQDEHLAPIGKANSPSQDNLPSYLWNNKENFNHLLKNPYETISIHNLV
ncbi:beta-1,4-mannosyl-glycoprotein 4-beta-N-acetylglucosaminyltransferase-like [Penaeus japonicus]|uniref:beta-1,4-mannosyl-glycoprotein 4-beta-N-acetylglucosaminyltransferase-like n=1 Tax=Penaeus japonicus TaxID=27405 RepID=UPI001C71676E|nr:beta-1,4-mannosyl-glycoprotein 4-beta-N-acetylglucosaminyltransferase-like [Penaeus japonicus]XP_042884023.1 beta-1,4-mannosyl-glycoprotein 4-beta-N-acetylglucosaminyltransferase-like [Penaeus japonicus]